MNIVGGGGELINNEEEEMTGNGSKIIMEVGRQNNFVKRRWKMLISR